MNSTGILDDLNYLLDDEDQDFNDFLNAPDQEERVSKKRQKLNRLKLETLTHKKCKSMFRFTYNEIARMCNAMKLESEIDFGRIKLNNKLALAMLLYSYAFPRRQVDISDVFGIETSNVSGALNGMADRLMTMFENGLEFDERQFSAENCDNASRGTFSKEAHSLTTL